MIRSADPYLNFPGNTEEAFHFYRSVFGGEFSGVVRFRDVGDNEMGVAEEELDRIAHISLPLGSGGTLMGTDVVGAWMDGFVVGTNSYIHLEVDGPSEAHGIFAALSEGGLVQMPLMRTEWAELYGSVRDRFGVQWMVSYTGSVVFPG
jgi:PhnB protein